MKKLTILILLLPIITITSFAQTIDPTDWPGMVGYWTFDNSSDITAATVGNDLELTGTQEFVLGESTGDGATRIGNDSYYKCTHGIAANGGGSYVNEYSLVIDFKIPSTSQYYCFFQTNTSNSNDGEGFVNPAAHVGISETYYTNCIIEPGEWYRLVIAIDLDNTYKYYIDGHLVLDGTSQSIDSRFSLDPYFYWFADDNDEDNEFDVTNTAIFNYTLNDTEAEELGGYGHTFPEMPIAGIDPYLQSPTPTSIYVSWHSTETVNTVVEYGTTATLDQQTNGSYQDIDGKTWHTVKLEGLIPNTEYFYKVTSGTDISEVSSFRTINDPTASGEHVRFLLLGDSRTDVYRTSEISQAAEQQLINTYGDEWQNEMDFVMHLGDVAETDFIDRYQNEFFTPYANISKKIPFMISVGNHEYNGAADNFFNYMKYEELTGPPYESGPFNEKFYKFQIGNTLFISINSNGAMDVQEQVDWLEGVLDIAETNSEIDFIFPFCHHPGHSEIWPDGNNSYVQDDILSLLKDYSKISMLSYGHSHGYERGAFELDSTNNNYRNDMHLLLSGGAGSALDRWGMYSNQQDYPEIHMTLDYYVYSIVDIDCDNKSWTSKTYSLGHPENTINNELIDEWYCSVNQDKPNTPIAIGIENQGTANAELIASTFSGIDSLMTSQFQLTETPGDYSSPILDITRDWQNLYGDSGSPNYTPVDLNSGIELNKLNVDGYIPGTQMYGWKVRYRDFNLKWSEWSNEYIINNACNNANTITETACDIYTVPSGAETHTTSGVYMDMIPNVAGCDSTITINLTVNYSATNSINTDVCYNSTYTYTDGTEHTNILANESYISTLTGQAASGCDSIVTENLTVLPEINVTANTVEETIIANASGLVYQWLDCNDDNNPISGETNQSFTATVNGNYAVIITEGACSDTSDCISIINIGISEFNNTSVSIYPNPTTGIVTISGHNIKQIEIIDIASNLIKQITDGRKSQTIDLSNQAKGIYFIKVLTNRGIAKKKLILE